ncbi:hypothetical protein CUJ84_Chr003138 [Rhizobium leguminosarum]|uniref:Uncharacterized protein n=1 Tax=Rhizobium leguminosarum TaxID=384 RepID=A0A2K9Z5M2_RHILE|nr:hypothetical protein CUJ84_Chr003138 [Rhizobium leguminosarum]
MPQALGRHTKEMDTTFLRINSFAGIFHAHRLFLAMHKNVHAPVIFLLSETVAYCS